MLFAKMGKDEHCIGVIDPECDIMSIAEGQLWSKYTDSMQNVCYLLLNVPRTQTEIVLFADPNASSCLSGLPMMNISRIIARII